MRAPALLAPVLRERVFCLSLLAAGAVLVALRWAGLSLFQCNFLAATGRPCPGCGMTRALTALLRGHVKEAWHWHPFSPLLAVAGCLMAVTLVLPERARRPCITWIEQAEHRTGAVWLACLGLMAYGVWRMCISPH